jgi:hypothetical protein
LHLSKTQDTNLSDKCNSKSLPFWADFFVLILPKKPFILRKRLLISKSLLYLCNKLSQLIYKKIYMKKTILSMLFFLLVSTVLWAVEPSGQKIFLHLNNNTYNINETIWFKGFIVDATDLKPDSSQTIVYLELWDIMQNKHKDLFLKPENGIFSGSIRIDKSYPDGNYVLFAYTTNQLNTNKDYIFHQNIYISNPDFANSISNEIRNFNREFNKNLELLSKNISVTLFPEGEHLINGISSRVAVSVKDATGKGKSTTVRITENGRVVTSTTTDPFGLGVFEIIPEAGKSYMAQTDLTTAPTVLPTAKSSGITLRVQQLNDDTLRIEIKRSADMANERVSLHGISHGTQSYKSPVLTSNVITLPIHLFPTGITQLNLLSGNGQTLSNRFIFINANSHAYLEIGARMFRQAEVVEGINLSLSLSDYEAQPLNGNLSALVYYDNTISRNYQDNIFSHFLLTSDIKQDIENPAAYFDFEQENILQQQDKLMLTLTDDKFRWPGSSTKTIPKDHNFPENTGITLVGSIKHPKEDLPLTNREVTLKASDNSFNDTIVITDGTGLFKADNLIVYDSTYVVVVPPLLEDAAPVVTLSVQPGALSQLDIATFFKPNIYTRPQNIVSRGKNWKRIRTRRTDTAPGAASAYGQPDQTIRPDDKINYTSVIDIIRHKGVGLEVLPNGRINFRGPSSIGYQAPPIFIIDGTESEAAFMSVNVNDIDRIEIFRGASTVAFGARGAGGALVVYTRRGQAPVRPSSTPSNAFAVNGLHRPVPFEIDPGKVVQNAGSGIPVTIFWEPNLVTNEEGLTSLSFPLIPGIPVYKIIIQGVSDNGKIAFSEFKIGD